MIKMCLDKDYREEHYWNDAGVLPNMRLQKFFYPFPSIFHFAFFALKSTKASELVLKAATILPGMSFCYSHFISKKKRKDGALCDNS